MKNRAKIGPESDSERQRQEKPTKNASGDVSGRTFSLPNPFLVDFGLPAGPPKSPTIDPLPPPGAARATRRQNPAGPWEPGSVRGAILRRFWVLRVPPGSDFGCSGCFLGVILTQVFDAFSGRFSTPMLLATCYQLLATAYFLLATCYLLHATC